jgi:hypothetical protein
MAKYDKNSKAYKIYDLRRRNIIINMDVKLDESPCFNHKLSLSEPLL